MSGAGIMLLSGDTPQGSVCTTNDVSALIEELQYTLGEGPCIDAHRLHVVVVEPDLADPATVAVDRVHEVGGGRRRAGGVRDSRCWSARHGVGALNLYRDQPGPLTDDQHADAVVLAGVAARAIIGMQAAATPGERSRPALETKRQLPGSSSTRPPAKWSPRNARSPSTEGAAPAAAAWAFGSGRPLVDVAVDVVARRLRFTP